MPAQNKQSIPGFEGLPVGFAGGGSQACGGLCSVGFPSFPNAEQEAQRNSLCLFPDGEGQDGVCKKYSCQHFTKQNCASLNPMLAFMDPTASPADYFSCEQLICVSCPHDAGVRGTLRCLLLLSLVTDHPAMMRAVPGARSEWLHVRRCAGRRVLGRRHLGHRR